MKITYDRSVDAAYIYFKSKEKIQRGWVKKTYPCDPVEVNGMINLDFDVQGYLGGIEVLGASKKLPQEVLDQAEIINKYIIK